MKKILAILLTVVLVAALSVTAVFAAPSAEAQGVISGVTVTDANGKEVELNVEKIDGNVNKYFYNKLVDLRKESGDKSLKVVGHYDLAIKGNPEYELSLVLNVLGISDASNVYVLLQKGNEVVAVTPDISDNELSLVLDKKYEKLAIVTDGKTAGQVEKENDVLSPQTADVTPYVAVIALISLVAIAVLPKKIKNV